MRHKLLHLVDRLVPADIKEFEQSEELARARSLVFVISANLLLNLALLVVTLTPTPLPEELGYLIPLAVSAIIFADALALWVFYRSGQYLIAGNLYAISIYVATMAAILMAESTQYTNLLLVLLALPVVVYVVVGHLSALLWWLVVAVSPHLARALGDPSIDGFFLTAWWTACAVLLVALFMENYYREVMRERLHNEVNRFEFAAAHDPLTGLANRSTFDRRLRECIEYCAMHDARAILVMIDLNEFKPINDTYGHQAGDIILTSVANRLRRLVRRLDTVARLGGDEFAVLFERCEPEKMDAVIARMASTISEPVRVFDNWLTVKASIGKAICPDDGSQPDELVHLADERMYADKRASRVAPTRLHVLRDPA